MEKKYKVYVTFGVLIVLITGLYYFTNWFSLVTGYFKGEDEIVRLTNCLNSKGAEFYGTEICARCEEQMRIFGKTAKSLRHIDCGKDKEFCPNLKEIPAFYIGQKFYYGVINVSEIKKISGCYE